MIIEALVYLISDGDPYSK